MAVVRELVTRLDFKANLRPLNKALDRVKRLKAAFSKFILGPAGIIGGVLVGAATAMFAFVNSVATGLDATAKLAKQLSISSDFLQEMAFAAGLSGASQEEFGVAIRTVSRNILEAQRGLETYEKAFRELGIDVKDTDGELRSIEDLLPEIADAFKNTIPETEKTGRALELFGRSGAKLLPLLNQGSKGIEKMRKEARELGIVFGKEVLVQAEEFRDEMLRFQSVLLGLKTTIGVAFLPEMRALIGMFRKLISSNKDFIKIKVIAFIGDVAEALGFVTGLVLNLIDTFRGKGFIVAFTEFIAEALGGLAPIIASLAIDISKEIAIQTAKGVVGALRVSIPKKETDVPVFARRGFAAVPSFGGMLPSFGGGGTTINNNIDKIEIKVSDTTSQKTVNDVENGIARGLNKTVGKP